MKPIGRNSGPIVAFLRGPDMSDIYVTPLAAGWTVRHERILFERFESRSAALRRARDLALTLRRTGEKPSLKVAQGPALRER